MPSAPMPAMASAIGPIRSSRRLRPTSAPPTAHATTRAALTQAPTEISSRWARATTVTTTAAGAASKQYAGRRSSVVSRTGPPTSTTAAIERLDRSAGDGRDGWVRHGGASVIDDPPILHSNQPSGSIGDRLIVRDQQDRLATVVVQATEQLEDL